MDQLTLSIAIGLVVSLLFTELYGVSVGGMIVPGYLALNLQRPASIAITLLAALLTFSIVRLLSHVAIVYGRRRIVMMILVGFLVGALLRIVPAVTGFVSPLSNWCANDCFCVIGYIIPGLIALWMDRQGWLETWAPLLTSSVLVRLTLIVLGVEVMR